MSPAARHGAEITATMKKLTLGRYKKADYGVSHQNWRIYGLAFFVFAASAIVIFRLYALQVLSYEAYKILAEDQHTAFKKLVPKRGEIFLKDGNEYFQAAVNKGTKMAYAVPKEIEDLEKTAGALSEIFSLNKESLKEKLEDPDDMYEVLKHRLNAEEIKNAEMADLRGVHLADQEYRYYPSGELASQVLGFVGSDGNSNVGRYGVEAYYEENLKGEEGSIFQSRDSRGRWIAVGERDLKEARNGDSLVLTIDNVVQFETEKLLKAAVERFGAEKGTIIVMEVDTGKILAIANQPAFDPNNYSQVSAMENYRNAAVSGAYESGSVFKTITMAAGLDSGKVGPDTIYVDTGAVKEAGYTIKNSDLKSYGKQTMSQVLENSLNTGAIFVEKLVGNRNFYDYVKRFGFGDPTGIDTIGETGGNLANLENSNRNIEYFTASFGQGISVTPIQLAAAYNAIANGGVLVKPYLVEKIIRAGEREEEIEPQEVRRVIGEKSAAQLSEMLKNVVEVGHGKRAGVPGYLVGGKTGTAQVASADSRGYDEDKTIGTFAGFAPINDPRFTILVRIDNPSAVQWAESSAAPVFGELMKFLLEYYDVEPTEKYTQQDLEIFDRTHNLRKDFISKDEEDGTEEEINDDEKDE